MIFMIKKDKKKLYDFNLIALKKRNKHNKKIIPNKNMWTPLYRAANNQLDTLDDTSMKYRCSLFHVRSKQKMIGRYVRRTSCYISGRYSSQFQIIF